MSERRRKTGLQNRCGFLGLTLALLVGSLGILLAAGVSLRAADALKLIALREQETRARWLADACMEDAILKLKNSASYAGNETIFFGAAGTCQTLAVISGGGSNRTVQTQSTIGTATQKIETQLTRGGTTRVTLWINVPDY